MTNDESNVVQSFKEYFVVEFAKSEEQKRKAYGIRYRVYCDEFKYESADQYPDHEEKDEADDYSLHCIIIHKKTMRPAACVRLIPAFKNNGEEIQLPFEQHCPESLDRAFIDNLNLKRESVCELSRLAVDHLFRRRPSEEFTRYGEFESFQFSKHERRTFSLISVANFLAAIALTELSEKPNVFAMMEPFLPRLLKRSGIYFQKVGVDVDYRGIRAPYLMQKEFTLEHMQGDVKELYFWILEQIRATY
ncbi:MAG: PEP-CTERM/exosortase system-associated acyltransferase [Methylococcaceae bacterium]|nr:PEP-CTERM/exosortase system-associated acyltransferase [Methylococcaceae bacterium]